MHALTVTFMDSTPVVSMDALWPEQPEQCRPYEVVVTVPRDDGGDPPVPRALPPEVLGCLSAEQVIVSVTVLASRPVAAVAAREVLVPELTQAAGVVVTVRTVSKGDDDSRSVSALFGVNPPTGPVAVTPDCHHELAAGWRRCWIACRRRPVAADRPPRKTTVTTKCPCRALQSSTVHRHVQAYTRTFTGSLAKLAVINFPRHCLPFYRMHAGRRLS